MNPADSLLHDKFPRSNAYHPEWIVENASGGANSLWLAEWLTSAIDLQPGMRVLDLGCGRACTSVFLAREFGVSVWATDLWFNAKDNWQRICDAAMDQQVFPIHADARNLPFAANFFDAILSIDAFPYFGTDDLYLKYLARLVKPGGAIAIAGSGFVTEIEDDIPSHLSQWLSAEPAVLCLHSAAWWQKHWLRSGIVDIELADHMVDGWKLWLRWHQLIAPENQLEIQTIEADAGRWLTFNRIVARRRPDIDIEEPLVSIPSSIVNKKPLLRDQQ